MKKHPVIRRILLLSLLALTFGSFQTVQACDRSQLVLDSISPGPLGSTNIHMQLCVGGGVLGLALGADGQTGRFLFSFTASCPGFTVNSFPTTITSDTIGVPYSGVNVGPQPAFNATQAIFYNNPANWYACINSTTLCGQPHTDCKSLVFNVSCLPDSIRIYGIEGGDNLFGGCYPNTSMLIDFTIQPVTWGNFDGEVENGGINLDWTTLQETNNSLFEIQRSSDGVAFTAIGNQLPVGNSSKAATYSFFDPAPSPGINYYKVKQVDYDGESSSTKTIAIQYEAPTGLKWRSVSPVPASEFVNLSFQSHLNEKIGLQVYDVRGREVTTATISAELGVNDYQLDVRTLNAGIYYLRIFHGKAILEKKIVVAK